MDLHTHSSSTTHNTHNTDRQDQQHLPTTLIPIFSRILAGMTASLGMITTLASVAGLTWLPTVDSHAFQMKPISRQYSRTREFNDGWVSVSARWEVLDVWCDPAAPPTYTWYIIMLGSRIVTTTVVYIAAVMLQYRVFWGWTLLPSTS